MKTITVTIQLEDEEFEELKMYAGQLLNSPSVDDVLA